MSRCTRPQEIAEYKRKNPTYGPEFPEVYGPVPPREPTPMFAITHQELKPYDMPISLIFSFDYNYPLLKDE